MMLTEVFNYRLFCFNNVCITLGQSVVVVGGVLRAQLQLEVTINIPGILRLENTLCHLGDTVNRDSIYIFVYIVTKRLRKKYCCHQTDISNAQTLLKLDTCTRMCIAVYNNLIRKKANRKHCYLSLY